MKPSGGRWSGVVQAQGPEGGAVLGMAVPRVCRRRLELGSSPVEGPLARFSAFPRKPQGRALRLVQGYPNAPPPRPPQSPCVPPAPATPYGAARCPAGRTPRVPAGGGAGGGCDPHRGSASCRGALGRQACAGPGFVLRPRLGLELGGHRPPHLPCDPGPRVPSSVRPETPGGRSGSSAPQRPLAPPDLKATARLGREGLGFLGRGERRAGVATIGSWLSSKPSRPAAPLERA